MRVSGQSIREEPFGLTRDGSPVRLFSLRNGHGLSVGITNFGGAVTSLRVPDRNGRLGDVVLGYSTLEAYESGRAYYGALIGRYSNRIAGGCFELDGVEYTLTANNPPNHLHGGGLGFDKVVWDACAEESAYGPSLVLSYLSRNGEEGFPGNLPVTVRYTLTHDSRLLIEYRASTDHATPVNLTHHGYFNLTGDPRNDVLGHELEINADHYTPVRQDLIPTGKVAPVAGTPFDFRTPVLAGSRIDEDHEQLRIGGGYDHNFVLNGWVPGETCFAARVYEPESGRVMEVHTSEPGMQFYTGNFLQDFKPRAGLCLETQHFPDSPNQPGFPATILRPGAIFRSRTMYSFSVR